MGRLSKALEPLLTAAAKVNTLDERVTAMNSRLGTVEQEIADVEAITSPPAVPVPSLDPPTATPAQ